MSNVYYDPEAFGLTMVDSLDIAGSYEFDIFAVWTDGKRLYWASDTGCSCPTPFENFHSTADLCTGSKADCLRAIESWADGSYHYAFSDVMRLRERVRMHRRTKGA